MGRFNGLVPEKEGKVPVYQEKRLVDFRPGKERQKPDIWVWQVPGFRLKRNWGTLEIGIGPWGIIGGRN